MAEVGVMVGLWSGALSTQAVRDDWGETIRTETKMETGGGQKRANVAPLALVRVERTPEEWLDLEFAEYVAAFTVAKGRQRPRRFYRIAEGQRHPLRVPARVLDDAMRARVPAEIVMGAITRALTRYVARKRKVPLPMTTDEMRVVA